VDEWQALVIHDRAQEVIPLGPHADQDEAITAAEDQGYTVLEVDSCHQLICTTYVEET
jgi:hypothetical protein